MLDQRLVSAALEVRERGAAVMRLAASLDPQVASARHFSELSQPSRGEQPEASTDPLGFYRATVRQVKQLTDDVDRKLAATLPRRVLRDLAQQALVPSSLGHSLFSQLPRTANAVNAYCIDHRNPPVFDTPEARALVGEHGEAAALRLLRAGYVEAHITLRDTYVELRSVAVLLDTAIDAATGPGEADALQQSADEVNRMATIVLETDFTAPRFDDTENHGELCSRYLHGAEIADRAADVRRESSATVDALLLAAGIESNRPALDANETAKLASEFLRRHHARLNGPSSLSRRMLSTNIESTISNARRHALRDRSAVTLRELFQFLSTAASNDDEVRAALLANEPVDSAADTASSFVATLIAAVEQQSSSDRPPSDGPPSYDPAEFIDSVLDDAAAEAFRSAELGDVVAVEHQRGVLERVLSLDAAVDAVGDQLGADTRRLSMALARHIAAAEVEVPSTIRNTSLLRHVAVEAEIAARLDDDVRVPASLKGIVDDAFSSGRGPRRVAEHFRAAAQDIAAVRLAPTTTTSDINATYDESCVATHVGPHEVHRTTLMVARSLLDDEARQLRASGPQLLELSALTEASAPSPIAPLRKAGSSATPRPNQSGLLTPSPVADSGFPSLTLGVQRPSGPASRTD